MGDQELLDLSGVARLLGVSYATARTYRTRGQLPPVDKQYGRTPLWRPETIRAWDAARPGRGVGGGRPRKRRS